MKLDLVLDTEAIQWCPEDDWEARLATLLAGWGPSEAVLQVVLSGDTLLRELNREYRDKDQPTDVLSFSYLKVTENDRLALLQGQASVQGHLEEPLLPEEEPLAGQVLISVDTVLQRNAEKGIPLAEHLALLAVHGMLHVLGFDHIQEEEALEMESWESRILTAFKPAIPPQSGRVDS